MCRCKGARVVVQGFGNVGGIAARMFHDAGAKVIALQDHSATLANEAGIDVHAALWPMSPATGGLKGFPARAPVSASTTSGCCRPTIWCRRHWKARSCPSARARSTKIVVEGANGPTTPAADDILRDRGILVVPDVLANAGGVTVSYFEWVQDFSSFFWSEDEINSSLGADHGRCLRGHLGRWPRSARSRCARPPSSLPASGFWPHASSAACIPDPVPYAKANIKSCGLATDVGRSACSPREALIESISSFPRRRTTVRDIFR
jgi:hypothetical protein